MDTDHPSPPAVAPPHGVAVDPNASASDPQFFFATDSLRQRLDLILHLIEFGRQIIIIAGVTGSGKSALLHQIKQRAPSAWRICSLQGSAALSTPVLLRRIAETLAITARGLQTEPLPEEQLRNCCASLYRAGIIVLIIVDDADAMPPDAAQTLLHIAAPAATGSTVRVILATGTAGARETPALPVPIDPGKLHQVVLPPFTREQTESYLAARFQATGIAGAAPWTAAMLGRIHREAAGNPGRINTLARQLLRGPAEPQRNPVPSREMPRLSRWVTKFGLLAVLGLIAVAVLSIQIFMPAEPGRPNRASGATPTRVTIPIAPPHQPERLFMTGDPVVVAPLAMAPSPAFAPVSPTPPPAELPEAALAVTVPSPAPQETVPELLRRGTAEWLLAQADGTYTVQLLAGSNQDGINRFKREEALDEVIIVSGIRQGRPWYVVTSGHYPDLASASSAVRALPPSVRRHSPWPRTIASLRANGFGQ